LPALRDGLSLSLIVALPRVGLSVLLDDDLRAAQLPLFAEGIVDAVEWTVDLEMGRAAPPWVSPLLDAYADAGALYGHGVHLSPLSAAWEARQSEWLDAARAIAQRRNLVHLSEHFGVMTAPGFSRGAPLPLPSSSAVTQVGRDRLARLADAVERPIGVENLALSMSRRDALAHGDQIAALVEGSERFVVLDLHNLFCQAASFDIAPDDLLRRMPLDRVREIHVSGGSVARSQDDPRARPFRRDTHDGPLPSEVFDLIGPAIDACANVEVVLLERLGGTFAAAGSIARYQDDYRRMRSIVHGASRGSAGPLQGSAQTVVQGRSLPLAADDVNSHEAEIASLAVLQLAWIGALHEATTVDEVVARLRAAPIEPAHHAWALGFDRRAVEVAMAVAKRWVRALGDEG